jgi:two-component system, LytTR family, sensor kinase
MNLKKITYRLLIHVAGWILLYLLPPLITQSKIELPQNSGDIMSWSLVIVFFYINYLWLVPNYLSKSRFMVYFAGILLMLSTCYFTTEIYVRHKYNIEIAEREKSGHPQNSNIHHRPPRFRGYFSSLFCFAILALGTSIRVTEGWYINEKQKKEMENQKLGAELSLLKSQINPHFFFNTLNSIYSLAIIKSDRTPEAVLKLSELMRYIIYDTERKVVPLLKEVEYIANYIELQRLRLPEEVKVKLKTDLGKGEAVIEPLLLLPFVENAFKHGVDVEKGGRITIEIKLTGNDLKLHVENPLVDDGGSIKDKHRGIGVNNTLKRLELLYQDNFTFTAGPVKNNYVVDLVLKIKENEMSDS